MFASSPALWFALASTATVGTTAFAAEPPPISATDEAGLAAHLWQHSPEVLAARRTEIDAASDAQRVRLLPNPTLSGTWSAIPLGHPVGDRWSGVPSYGVGVSQLFELGKRGPRREAADAERRFAGWAARDVHRQVFFAVLDSLGDGAAAALREASLLRMIETSDESLRLQKARADRGDAPALEVDRLAVDHARLRAAEADARASVQEALAVCARWLAGPCPAFADEERAGAFLNMIQVPPAPHDSAALAARPDVRAIGAERERLLAELRLAERRKIPDPSAGIGYLRDTLAGNQPSSVSLFVSLPVPLFDRGQVEVARVRQQLEANADAARGTIGAAAAAVAAARSALRELVARGRMLDEQALPAAKSVADRMEAAARRGGVALPDVLLARRAYQELVLDRIDAARSAFRAALEIRRALGVTPEIVP